MCSIVYSDLPGRTSKPARAVHFSVAKPREDGSIAECSVWIGMTARLGSRSSFAVVAYAAHSIF